MGSAFLLRFQKLEKNQRLNIDMPQTKLYNNSVYCADTVSVYILLTI